ncbi:tetratricopeptide repeat-containing sulfotransferase family protein [Fimbriimonas ginsengisoli]|uniref:Tpr domain protein n=1 Tax=Fimbriimonas ginsengisoli Gsoil 348 TaxID=661478 RepID=A0A068NT11_FIMGI|nr:tetratricopeptide repeat-containing sulfotransferase family protein [Fimbriimonas ginsengisoli]AIE86487.1 tpr domain protein [Fimbriimonas ginsengisoli Gsoil 348]
MASPELLNRSLQAYARNELHEARLLCREQLAANPNDVEAHVLMGAIRARLGNVEGAIKVLYRALELNPNSVEALVSLSTISFNLRQFEAALAHAQAAAELQPKDPAVLQHFARQLEATGHQLEAASVLQRIAELQPDDVAVLERLAHCLRESRREIDALAVLRRIATLRPDDLAARLKLGQLEMAHGKFDEALSSGREAIRIAPQSATAHLLVALALAESERGDEAEPYLLRAAKLDSNEPMAQAALGFWFQERGRFNEAKARLERAISLNPNHGFAYYNLFRAKKAGGSDRHTLAKMRVKADDPALPIRDRSYLHYALGKAHEDLNEYGEAIRHYDAGNRLAYDLWLADRPWDREAYSAGFSRTIDVFSRDCFDELRPTSNSSELPLIIVGMIRSGTSLLEQILSSHPDIAGAGELPYWHQHEPETLDPNGRPREDLLPGIAEGYLQKLRSLAPEARRVTDKLPHNYAMLGLIHTVLPNCRIVHMTRNPADNCLSVYTTAYQRPPVFAHDRSNIVFAYREYQRIMSHWRQVLPPDRFIEIEYESLITDREPVVRRLLEFCGLPWDDACLQHESNTRAVRTPSLWQVRQPIYGTSIERWRRFEDWIPEFTALVGEER